MIKTRSFSVNKKSEANKKIGFGNAPQTTLCTEKVLEIGVGKMVVLDVWMSDSKLLKLNLMRYASKTADVKLVTMWRSHSDFSQFINLSVSYFLS